MENNKKFLENEDVKVALEKAKEVSENPPEEDVNNESLEKARNDLVKLISKKTPASARSVINETVIPMVSTLSESDCKAMADVIKKKGLMGALMTAKKKTKKK